MHPLASQDKGTQRAPATGGPLTQHPLEWLQLLCQLAPHTIRHRGGAASAAAIPIAASSGSCLARAVLPLPRPAVSGGSGGRIVTAALALLCFLHTK